MVDFLNPLASLANFTVFQITFQAIKIEVARFQHKTFLKRSQLLFTFISSCFKAYFNQEWGAVAAHICQLLFFRKKIL